MLATVLVLVFAAGLRRRLAAQAPVGSLLRTTAMLRAREHGLGAD